MSTESGGLPPKRIKQFAAQGTISSLTTTATPGSNDNNGNSVIIKGASKRLRQYSPSDVDKGLRKVLGANYADIKVLPSGDICVKCANRDQVRKILCCDDIGSQKMPIPIHAELYRTKPAEVRGVISDVPLDLTDEEIKLSLSNQRVTFVRRLNYRNKDGEFPSGSVMVCFSASFLPQVVSIGYMRFRTRPYKPPPLRCFNCNRYGHTGKNCRSSQKVQEMWK